MAGIQRTTTPFSGNFYDSDGVLRNIDGFAVTGKGFKNSNTQINGDYYDHEGKIRNIKELLDSFRGGSGANIPNGGTTGQALGKISDADGDVGWITVSASGPSLPDGGTTGQVLAKSSNTDGDADWVDLPVIPVVGYWATITGDGVHKTFSVQHNLGTVFTMVKVLDTSGSPQQEIIPEVNVISTNALTVTLTNIPANGEVYNVYILAIIQAAGTPGVANPV